MVRCSTHSKLRKQKCATEGWAAGDSDNRSTWLWSYQGSGNTWLRILLELATRRHTGSMFVGEPSERQMFCVDGMRGSLCKMPVAVKVHGTALPQIMPCNARVLRTVLLVRAPGGAIWAEWQRRRIIHIRSCVLGLLRGYAPCHH